MEKYIALVSKSDNRVKNILLVDSFDNIDSFNTDEFIAISVTDPVPHLHGLWDGENFAIPTEEYLISIGLLPEPPTEAEIEAEATKAAEKAALLTRLGITADEAKLLLG